MRRPFVFPFGPLLSAANGVKQDQSLPLLSPFASLFLSLSLSFFVAGTNCAMLPAGA